MTDIPSIVPSSSVSKALRADTSSRGVQMEFRFVADPPAAGSTPVTERRVAWLSSQNASDPGATPVSELRMGGTA
jgi:hypothetical protein